MAKILVVSPHPDDAEIGCGGLLSRERRLGNETTIAVCTGPGDLKMVHSGQVVEFDQRIREQEAAAKHLGVNLVWLNLAPASKFDTTPQAAFVSAFDQLFKEYDTVILPLPSYNADHTRVWETGLAAFRPGKLNNVSLQAYEQACSNPLGPQIVNGFGKRYISLSGEDVQAKQAALSEHHSQIVGREVSLCGPAAVDLHARLRGMEVGTEYAELLYLVRELHV